MGTALLSGAFTNGFRQDAEVLSRFLGMAESIGPELVAYRDRITARPAFGRADAA